MISLSVALANIKNCSIVDTVVFIQNWFSLKFLFLIGGLYI